MIERLSNFLARPRGLVGMSLLRISLGSLILYHYFTAYSWRHYLWAPNGVWPHESFLRWLIQEHSLSLYQFAQTPLLFESLYHLGILCAVLFTLGLGTPIVPLLNFVFFYSLQERNPFLLSGEDSVLRLVLFYLLFAHTTAYLSPGSKTGRAWIASHPRSPLEQGRLILQSAAVFAIVIQICIIYLSNGYSKMTGLPWRDGTAVYYALRLEEFTWPGISEKLYQSALFVKTSTYATLSFELAFPLLLLTRYTRYLAVTAGIVLHSFTALLMGLFGFSWVTISCYFVLISDEEFLALRSTLSHRRREN